MGEIINTGIVAHTGAGKTTLRELAARFSPGLAVMGARVPVAASLTCLVDFGFLTRGKGIISSRFSGCEPCPIKLGKTAKRRRIDPRDRTKWILHARQVLQ